MTEILFKQIRSEGGCLSFILADPKLGKACLIDPRADEVSLYEDFLAKNKLTLSVVIDTHTHADHYSGSHLLVAHFGVPIAMGASTRSARATIKLKDKDAVEVSSGLALETIETPGHTPDSLSFFCKTPQAQIVFTGDTLFIGSSGRTDFPGADPAAQYDSIYRKLAHLPGPTWVFPGHDYSDLLFSTLDYEKKHNPHWQFQSQEEFVQMKKRELLDCAGIIQQIVDFNMNAHPTGRIRSGAHTQCATVTENVGADLKRVSIDEMKTLLAEKKQGVLFIDVREPEEFAQGYIDGMVNIPLSQVFLHAKEFQQANQVYFSCQRANRSRFVAQTFKRLGQNNVADMMGGFAAWAAQGNPIKR